MQSGRTDPELVRQLDEAREQGGANVEAAVSIVRAKGRRPDPDEIEAAAHAAITRATESSGTAAADVHVMANLAVAYVSGPEALIRELLEQPEITGATANRPARS